MKVLIVGHADFYGGGKTALIMEALIKMGHEIKTVRLKDLPFDGFSLDIEPVYDEVSRIPFHTWDLKHSACEAHSLEFRKQPKGVRGRWGKLK